jgi:hypothetical protein
MTQVSIYTWLYRAKSLERQVEAKRTSGYEDGGPGSAALRWPGS